VQSGSGSTTGAGIGTAEQNSGPDPCLPGRLDVGEQVDAVLQSAPAPIRDQSPDDRGRQAQVEHLETSERPSLPASETQYFFWNLPPRPHPRTVPDLLLVAVRSSTTSQERSSSGVDYDPGSTTVTA